MDKFRGIRPTPPGDHEVLDESDPHAGDEAEPDEDVPAPIVAPPESSPLDSWRGLLLGLVLSAAVWCVLALAAFGLYNLLR